MLWDSGRFVTRVSFPIDSWLPVPRQIRIAQRVVRLGGFAHQDASLISLRDAYGSERIDVLVIPPDVDSAVAAKAMLLVSQPGRNERAATLLAQARQ